MMGRKTLGEIRKELRELGKNNKNLISALDREIRTAKKERPENEREIESLARLLEASSSPKRRRKKPARKAS